MARGIREMSYYIVLTKRGNGWFYERKKWDKGKESEFVFGDGICTAFRFGHNGRFKISMTKTRKGKYYFCYCGVDFCYLVKQTAKQRRCLGVISVTLLNKLLDKLEYGKNYDIQIEQVYLNDKEREATEPKKDKYLGKSYYHMGFKSHTVPVVYKAVKETFGFITLRSNEESNTTRLKKDRFLELLKQRRYSSNKTDVLLELLTVQSSIVESTKKELKKYEQKVSDIKKVLSDMD